MFSLSSAVFGTLACTGAIFPVTPGLLEFGRGRVTLEFAIAAAVTDDADAEPDAKGLTSSGESASRGGEGSDEGRGREGLKTGAAADIREALATDGTAGMELDARRLGGVELLSGILKGLFVVRDMCDG